MQRAVVEEGLIRRFLPLVGSQAADSETVFRAQLALGFGLFEVVVTALISATELIWGMGALSLIYGVGLAANLFALVWLRRGADAYRVGTTLVAIAFGLVTVSNFSTGGQSIWANIALPTVVLFAVLMSSRRAGAIWVSLVVVEILVVAILRRSAIDFPFQPNPAWIDSAIDRVPMYFSLGSALIGWVVLHALELHRSRLGSAHRAETVARSAAAHEAERFTDFAEIAADGFWETDADLRLTYLSNSVAQAMGINPSDALGRTPEQAYLDRFPEVKDVSAFMAPLRMRRPIRDQLLVSVDADANKHLLLNFARPFFDDKGEFKGFRGAVRDVTWQKRVERALQRSEARLSLITEAIPALIAYLDREERYRYCNARVTDALGIEPRAILDKTMREVRGEDAYAELAPHVASVLAGKTVTFESEGLLQGKHTWFQTTYVPEIVGSSKVMGFYCVTFDITAVKLSELALAAATRRLRLIADNMPAAITHVDLNRRFTYSNLTHHKWLGRAPGELAGQLVSDIHGPDIYDQISPQMDLALSGERTTFDFVGGGRHYRATYVPELDDNGAITGAYGLIHDVSKVKQIESELRTMAQFDALTGLANRRRFDELLTDAIARSERNGLPIGLMFLDLDHFKQINDTRGHKVGDLVLREFAKRISGSVRRTDTVARLAGDEFVVILEPMANDAAAATVARKIIQAVTVPCEIEGKQLRMSASIGIALRHAGEVDGEALLRRADTALYAVKAEQRGGFRMAK